MPVSLKLSAAVRPPLAHSHGARGLSLIEILVVLAIIALVTSGVAVYALEVYEDSKYEAAANEIAELGKATDLYRLRRRTCPESFRDLFSAGLITVVRKDPWGADYVFTCPGEHGPFDIVSAGGDGELGTDDDVRSWDLQRRPQSD